MADAALSSRRRVIIIVAICAVVVIVAAGIFVFVNSGSSSAGGGDGDGTNQQLSAQDVATEFVDGVIEDSSTDAGQLTTNPSAATNYIDNVHREFKPHTPALADLKVVTKNTTATVTYTLNWALDSSHTWTDPAGFTMSQDTSGAWKVNWSVTSISDKLQAGDQLQLGDQNQAATPTVLAGDGSTLLGPNSTISSTFASAIMPAIRNLAGGQTGSPAKTVSVFIAHGDGSHETLYSTGAAASSTQATTITTTLNTKLQEAAETALGTVPQEAMAVVVQPSTGKILAVARNSAASGAGDNPLTGLYPPGSTFKIVTASAGLNQGKITPQTSVACPGTVSIEGRTIQNETKFDLGTTSVTNAFAQSCNTTFSELATQLGPSDLSATAKQFGIGVDYQIPGFTTNNGKIPSDTDTLARAEDGFGQGTDLVSPFAMALAAATAAHGSTPVPSLIAGQTTQSDTAPTRISSSTLSSLKTLMRAVVTAGTAADLKGVSPAVYGKTGTAQFGDGTHSHGWFVGYQGDVAFAFLVVDAGKSEVAVQVAHSFFSNGG